MKETVGRRGDNGEGRRCMWIIDSLRHRMADGEGLLQCVVMAWEIPWEYKDFNGSHAQAYVHIRKGLGGSWALQRLKWGGKPVMDIIVNLVCILQREEMDRTPFLVVVVSVFDSEWWRGQCVMEPRQRMRSRSGGGG